MTTVSVVHQRSFLGHTVTQAALSDGREIIYFDDVGRETQTRATDNRPPVDRASTPELRLDPLTREWVSIAPTRNQRAFLPTKSSCPLCAQNPENASEIPGPFDVAVFENKSPSFGPELAGSETPHRSTFGSSAPAAGRCEVVVFGADHDGSFVNLDPARIDTVIAAWTQRTEELKEIPGVKTVFPFENRGEDIGVTLHHPHGQIYSYPFIPPRTAQLLASSRQYGGNFFGEYLTFEAESPRLVLAGEHFSAFVPYAARWPIEMIVMPHREVADFTELSDFERAELKVLLPRILGALDGLYESETPYIASWHQAPRGTGANEFRFHFRVTSPKRAESKLKVLAGSETAMGAYILDVAPEAQARSLRDRII